MRQLGCRNYCYCDAGCSAGTVSGGTCLLQYQANNFYPTQAAS